MLTGLTRRRIGMLALAAALTGRGLGMAAADSKMDPNAKGPDGLPIIFAYIEREDQAAVTALLDAGADIEAKGFFQATPMLSAALVDLWPMVALLISRGANLWAVDQQGVNLPWLTAHAKVRKGSPTEAALNAVRATLNERAMRERIYDPAQALALMKAGRWPPG